MTEPSLILVADDDPHIVELVSLYLRRAGYNVDAANDGDETLRKLRERRPALVVLDVMMPGPDGFQICRQVKGRVPVLLLTARSSDIDKIAGLRIGADDYVTKPFNPDELVARVEAVLRRTSDAASADQPSTLKKGNVLIEPDRREASIDGRHIALTPREFDLLVTFARLPNIVLDRDQLLDLVWGTSFYGLRTVDVHVARLRDKLKDSGVHIETVWGAGYRLEEDDLK